MSWPTSNPDYRWPEGSARGVGHLGRAGIFHAASALGWLVSKLSRGGRKILFIRTDGLGDGVLSEPMIRAVAQRYPAAQIHLWAPAATCELFAAGEYVRFRQIIPRGFKEGCLEYLRSARWHWKMGWNLGRCRFDIAIYPAISPEPLGNWIFRSVRADKRWMVKGDLFHQFESQQNMTLQAASRVFARPGAMHELDANAELAWQCGANEVDRNPELSIDAEAQEQANIWLARWQTSARAAEAEGLLGIVTAGSMNQFTWPSEKWQSAITEIWTSQRLMPIFLSPPVTLEGGIPFAILDGTLSVLGLAAILREMDVVLTLDTGPAHLAAALRVPTVVLSNGGHPGRFFPWPEAPWVQSLVYSMPCASCVCRCTLAGPECLTRIEVSEVVEAVTNVYRKSFSCAA